MSETAPEGSMQRIKRFIREYWLHTTSILVVAAAALATFRIEPGAPWLTTHERYWAFLTGLWMMCISVVGLAVVYYQLHRHRRDRSEDHATQMTALSEDHNRRRMQATVEFVNHIRPRWRLRRRQIIRELGAGPISKENAEKLYSDPPYTELQAQVTDVLGLLEHLSVGVHAGVFDLDMLYQMSGTYLIKIFDSLEEFITLIQKRERSSHYANFAALAEDFRERHKQPIQEQVLISDERRVKKNALQ